MRGGVFYSRRGGSLRLLPPANPGHTPGSAVKTWSKGWRTRLGVGIGAGVASVGVLWAWVAPSVVQARAEQALTDRLGMAVKVGSTRMGLASATLRAVELEGRQGGVSVHLGEVRVGVGLSVLWSGSGGVRSVSARDVRVQVDLDHPGASGSIAQVREALGTREEGAGEAAEGDVAGGRELSMEDVEVHVRDGGGPRLTVQGGKVRVADGVAKLEAASARHSSPSGHEVSLGRPSVELERGAQGWMVGRATAGAVRVVLEQWRDEEQAIAAEDDAQAKPAATPSGEGKRRWTRRLGDAFDRLAPAIEVDLSNMTILSRVEANGNEEVILDALRVELRGQGGGAFRSSGSGRAANDGQLAWDVLLRPGEARAEGTLRFRRLPLALVAPLLPAVPWHRPERAHLDGNLEVRAESPSRMALRGEVSLSGAAIASARIAPEPVEGISVTVQGEGFWMPEQRQLRLEAGTLRSASATLRMEGTFEWSREHYLVAATMALPPTACDDAVGAIPPDLLGEIAGFRWRGELAGKIVAYVDSRDLDATRLDIRMADGCRFAQVPPVADMERFRRMFLHQVREPDDSVFEMLTGPGSSNWHRVRAMSPFLVHAVIAHEDASFLRHQGFAPWAIEEALKRNLKAGRYEVGASTITMQLAKNLFLRREKTLARKVQEVLLTWWLESALDKRDILELYLNVIEYGPGVYGIRHAASHYFGRAPSDLSPAESAFLATILPNPKRHAAEHADNALKPSTAVKMRRLLRHMAAKNRINTEAVEHGLAQVDAFRFHSPGEPHPAPRELPGQAGPLPVGIADEAAGSGWHRWDGIFEGDEAREWPADEPYRSLPQVDPDAFYWD
jgi:hypothetical protein